MKLNSNKPKLLPRPLHRSKLSDYVYHKIFEKIASNEYAVGGRMPSENELSAEHSASRTVVREALSKLRNDGMIVSRKGSGSYVTGSINSLAFSNKKTPLTVLGIQCCYEVRVSLEGEAAYFAALRANKQAVNKLKKINSQIELAASSGVYDYESDWNFHAEIARTSNNFLFVQLMELIREHSMISMQIGGTCLTSGEYSFVNILDEHKKIIKALERGDADQCRQHMRTHIETALQRVFEEHLFDLSI